MKIETIARKLSAFYRGIQLVEFFSCESDPGIVICRFKCNLGKLKNMPFSSVTLTLMDATDESKQESGDAKTGHVTIWPSEQVLAYICLLHRDAWTGLTVLEMGAGLSGLAGLMLAMNSDTHEVLLSDGSPSAVQNLEAVIHQNLPRCSNTKVSSHLLRWDDPSTYPRHEVCNNHQNLNMDSTKSGGFKKFDVIIMADCLYFHRHHESLLTAIERLLSPKGLVILVDPRRSGEAAKFLCFAADTNGWNGRTLANYDDEICKIVLADQISLGSQKFDSSMHYPIVSILYRKSIWEGGNKQISLGPPILQLFPEIPESTWIRPGEKYFGKEWVVGRNWRGF